MVAWTGWGVQPKARRDILGRGLAPPPTLDLSMVKPCPVKLEDMPHGRLNFIDLQTAIELYTPVYQLLLTDNDFWRASNSLPSIRTPATRPTCTSPRRRRSS